MYQAAVLSTWNAPKENKANKNTGPWRAYIQVGIIHNKINYKIYSMLEGKC